METDIYYTSEHHDFAARGEALRIWKVENPKSGKETCLITYKGAKLEQIGFCPVSPVEKQRLYLRKDNMTACLDDVKGLGNYLELEILTDAEEDIAQGRVAPVQETFDDIRSALLARGNR